MQQRNYEYIKIVDILKSLLFLYLLSLVSTNDNLSRTFNDASGNEMLHKVTMSPFW